MKTSEQIIKVQLMAYIARNFIDNNGFYPIIAEIDETINVALKYASKPSNEFNFLLSKKE